MILCFIYIYIYIYIYICIYLYMFTHMCVSVCIYIYIYIYKIHTKMNIVCVCVCHAFNKFPDFFFVQAFKIVVDSWKFTMLLLYILWDDWPILMISGSNEQQQQQLEYTLLKPDCHSWWISKMQSGYEDTLEERYAIKFCFKMPQKRMECFRLLLDHLAWIEHQFLSDIKDSRKARSLWGMMRCGRSKEVNTPDWLAKGLGLLCWGFKGVQEEILLEEASTLQIGSVDFH